MEQSFEATITTKESFVAVGFQWEGTFAEAGAGAIRALQQEFKDRLHEIQHRVHSDILLGLSNHIAGDRFTHYCVVEVEKEDEIPEGMISIHIPTHTYARCEHKSGNSIEQNYTNIFTWIEKQGYRLNKETITHFEQYPMWQDVNSKDPEFVIMIPID